MALAMVRPYKHPKTGVYWLRKIVPAPIRAVVGRLEFKRTLGTKDPGEARRLAPPVVAKWESIIAAARTGRRALTQRDIDALCGEWYQEECSIWGDGPGTSENWELYVDHIASQFDDDADPINPPVTLTERDRDEARELLERHGHVADPKTVERLGAELLSTKIIFGREMGKRAAGDWSPDRNLEKFPALTTRPTVVAPEAAQRRITVDALVAAWATETGTSGKALYDRERTANLLTKFLEHNDANRVTADDVVRWKEARQKAQTAARRGRLVRASISLWRTSCI